jgi:hypothetical protein
MVVEERLNRLGNRWHSEDGPTFTLQTKLGSKQYAVLRIDSGDLCPYATMMGNRSASGNAPLQRVQAPIRHKQAPPYGLPSHLFRFYLELASAPPRSGHWVLFLMIVRSFLALKNQKQKGSRESRGCGIASLLCRQNGGPRGSQLGIALPRLSRAHFAVATW